MLTPYKTIYREYKIAGNQHVLGAQYIDQEFGINPYNVIKDQKYIYLPTSSEDTLLSPDLTYHDDMFETTISRDVFAKAKNISQKQRKPVIKKNLIDEVALKDRGWSDRQIQQLNRYLLLENEFRNVKKLYENKIKYLSDKPNYSDVTDKLKNEINLDEETLLLNNNLLVNVIEKTNPNVPKASDLANKLRERFAQALQQYNINLDSIIEEIRDENKSFYRYFNMDFKESFLKENFLTKKLLPYIGRFISKVQYFISKIIPNKTEVENYLKDLIKIK